MRRAIVIGSGYEKHPELRPLPSSATDAQLLVNRLNEYDLGFTAVYLPASRQLRSRLQRALEEAGRSDLLVYFSGHVALTEDGGADVLLDDRRGGRVPVVELVGGSAAREGALLVADVAHGPAAGDPTASTRVVAAFRDAVDPARSGTAVLVAARPSDRPAPTGPSLFTRLFLQCLEQASPPSGVSAPVTAGDVYAAMRADEDRFVEIPATGYFRGRREIALVPAAGGPAATAGSEADLGSPPSSEPMSSRAPKKPRSRRSGEARKVEGPPDATATAARGDALVEGGRVEEAVREYKKALLLHGHQRSSAQVTLYVKIARAMLVSERSAEALSNYEKALSIDPAHPVAFEGASELLRRQRDFAQLDLLHRRRLETAAPDDRFAALVELAALWVRDAGDPGKGAEILEKALAIRPKDRRGLELLVVAQDRLERHARAVAARRRLAGALDDDVARARVLAEAARVTADHLPNKADAVDLAGEALALDPRAYVALEVAAAVLGRKRRWRDLVKLYESVLERTDDDVAADLARKVGYLYRDELDDLEGAERAFQKALEHEPSDVDVRWALAELHLAERDVAGASEQYQAIAREQPRNADAYRRALWCFERQERSDAAWRASCALDYLGEADINESLLADQHRPDGPLDIAGGLTEEDWLEGMFNPERDDGVNAILSTVAGAAIRLRLSQLDEEGALPELDPATRQDPERSTTTICRSLSWTARVLGIDVPELHVWPEVKGDLAVLPTEKPTVVASKSLAMGLSLPELAFLWGRNVPLHRPEHRLVVFFPTLRRIAVLFLAALALGSEESEVAGSLDGEAAAFAVRLGEELDADERALLRHAASRFEPARARRRVRRWASSIQHACNRAGLLACGDIELAARLIERFPAQTDVSAEDQIGDLLAYSISDAYETLRQRLGVEARA